MFQYRRLESPRSIRVLLLQPSTDFDSPLRLVLSNVRLGSPSESRRQYEALSYVWGAREGTQPVECNGATLLITPNCEAALRYLRLPDIDRALWVDAICIDQSGSEQATMERNVQVALMGEIYKSAARTWCWLGEGTAFTKDVIFHLNKIGECPSQRGLGKLLLLEKQLHTANHLDHDASCLDHLFCHPWHTRIWTVQEAAYSTDCRIMCGHNSLPWPKYSAAAEFLIYDQFIETLDIQTAKSMASIHMRTVLREFLFGQDSRSSQGDLPSDEDSIDHRITFLTSCLTDVNQFGASDPKDKIYALQAVFTDLGIPLPDVEYATSIASVYTKAALAMIEWSGSLKVLRDACSLKRLPSLPTWVPDWNDGEIRLFMPDTLSDLNTKLAHENRYKLSPEPGKLQIRGVVLGKVNGYEGVWDPLPFPTRSKDSVLSIISSNADYRVVEDVEFLKLFIDQIRWYRELLQNIQTVPTGLFKQSPDELFYDLLTHGSEEIPWTLFEIWLDILGYPDSTYDYLVGRVLAEEWKAADIGNVTNWTEELMHCSTIAAALLSNSIERGGQPLSAQPEVLDMLKTMSSNQGDQTVISLQLDRMSTLTLGTAFCIAMSGDQLIWLEGADWPVLLRSAGTEWLFIGPAYVNGLEELLADDDSIAKSNPSRDFTII